MTHPATAPSRPEGAPIATIRGARKRYPGVVALDGVDFDVAPGEVRALLGKNGAGKSTLIRLLTGAAAPDAGEVLIGGTALAGTGSQRTIEAARLGVRAVYQELSLVPGMSIAENLFLGRWPRRGGILDHGAMDRLCREALGNLGLDLPPARRVEGLSPAERQLVEIARALLGRPRLVILDEPTSSLAAAEVERLFGAVRRLAAAGIAVIYVSHRMAEIREIAASATVMRDGRVVDTVDIAGASTAEIGPHDAGSRVGHGASRGAGRGRARRARGQGTGLTAQALGASTSCFGGARCWAWPASSGPAGRSCSAPWRGWPPSRVAPSR